MRRAVLVVSAVAASAMSGCTDDLICTTSVEPAVVVEIRDAVDASPLAEGARGAARDGAFTDSLRPYGSTGQGILLSRAAADERAGTYAITIDHPGYLTWARSGVTVTQDACHVETVQLVAHLERGV